MKVTTKILKELGFEYFDGGWVYLDYYITKKDISNLTLKKIVKVMIQANIERFRAEALLKLSRTPVDILNEIKF
jgi:hypothetical protein